MAFLFGRSKKPTRTIEVEATAYCGCGRCCGWEHGIGLGPLPVYLPLAWKRRASGTQPIPLLPRMRKSDYGTEDRQRGAAWGLYYGALLGACLWTVESVFGLPPRGGLGAVKSVIQRCPRLNISKSATALGATAAVTGWALQTPVAISAATFGALGYTVFPVSRFWAETHLAGRRYEGTTATNKVPKTPVPPLLSLDALQEPWTIPHRLLLFRWGGTDGTVAADTSHFPFGTRMKVPGYGWGVVEDRGGAIKGPIRIDLFHRDHLTALRWGRQKVKVVVEVS